METQTDPLVWLASGAPAGVGVPAGLSRLPPSPAVMASMAKAATKAAKSAVGKCRFFRGATDSCSPTKVSLQSLAEITGSTWTWRGGSLETSSVPSTTEAEDLPGGSRRLTGPSRAYWCRLADST